jgi:Archaeal phage integrase
VPLRHFEPTCPFGHGISNFNEKDFENQLKLQKKSNFKQIFYYALKYKNVLLTGDAKMLLSLPSAQRRHAMEGLAALSKYVGCYDNWKNIREKYQLRWSNSEQENLKFFTNYMTGKGNFDEMVKWLDNATSKLPIDAANVLMFNTLTGLRPTEAVLSIQLIKSEQQKYINRETGMLEHFRYPDIFIRKTKKAYITAFNDVILEVAVKAHTSSWKAIRSQLKRRGLESHLKYCRAIFATYLRKQGIESEVIDIYQGRVPTSVFAAHYLKTNIEDDRNRILKAVGNFYEQITCK